MRSIFAKKIELLCVCSASVMSPYKFFADSPTQVIYPINLLNCLYIPMGQCLTQTATNHLLIVSLNLFHACVCVYSSAKSRFYVICPSYGQRRSWTTQLHAKHGNKITLLCDVDCTCVN